MKNMESNCPLDWATPGNFNEMLHALSDCDGCCYALCQGRNRSCAAKFGSAKRKVKLLAVEKRRKLPPWLAMEVK